MEGEKYYTALHFVSIFKQQHEHVKVISYHKRDVHGLPRAARVCVPVDGALRAFVENSAGSWRGRVGVGATET